MSDTKVDMGPFPGKLGPHTARAVERMRTGKPGDTLTTDTMADVIGRSCGVQESGRKNVDSAIRILERDYQVVWRWSRPDQVWQCLDDAGRVGVMTSDIRGARKRARRTATVGMSVDVSKLDTDTRAAHALNTSIAGMMHMVGGAAFRNRLAKIEAPREPEIGKLVDMMKERS